MGIMIQPTKNRFGVYHIRKAVPKHLVTILGKREIKLTLDTKDVKEARERAPAKIIQIDLMLRLAEKQLAAEQTLTEADIELIAGVWASKTMQQDELIRERYIVEDELDGKSGLFHSPENDLIHTYLEDRARKPRFKLQSWQEKRDISICKLLAVELDEALGYTPVTLTPLWRNRLAWRLAERRSELTNAYLLNVAPKAYARKIGLDKLPEPKQRSLTFADLFEQYKDYVGRYDPLRLEKRIKAYTTSVNRFIEFVGQKPIEEITVSDLAGFRNLLEELPSRPDKATRELPLVKQAEMPGPKLGADRVKNALNELSSIFRVAVENGKLSENPARLLKKRKRIAKSSDAKTYTNVEIAQIFSLPLFRGEAVSPYGAIAYWIPILLYYTGARIEEVAQLRREDVIEEEGIRCICIRMGTEQSTKTGYARVIPLHSHLIELGFLDYVATRHLQLFTEKSTKNLKYSYNFGRWWGNYLRSNGFNREGFKPSHSFRHAFIANYRFMQNRAKDVENSITGHQPRSVDEGYGSFAASIKQNVIEQIPRLNLEPLEQRFPVVKSK